MKVGKITRITDLRSIWPHEANDFTKWLADEHNLAKLGEEIDIELELEERESSVGNFNVDHSLCVVLGKCHQVQTHR